MEKQEQIGSVKLDYTKYPGEDFYCDGAVEDELLDIVKNLSDVEYAGVIQEKKSWPILYHLSPLRENIVEWLPMDKGAKVLEVGSGCGAITGALSRKAGEVVCVDLSKKRSLINAWRHSDCGNVTIHVGNFKDIEPDLADDFDYICLIGVFEYGQSYIGGAAPFQDFLKILLPHLKKGGRIIIAIENKYGLKYFAGCREDHLGSYFSSIENYAEGGGVRTFSRQGLERIFADCGVKESHFYYPYPDYKFMTTLYSDRRLPHKGELYDNFRNFDRDRMLLFDEKSAFDGLMEDELFPIFSNSYVAVLGGDFEVDYVKYSNDRADEYAIRTQICSESKETKEQKRCVRKYPLTAAAADHVRGMEAAYRTLLDKYRGGKLEINKCTLHEEDGGVYAQFDFVTGVPLSTLMDECLEKQDIDAFHELFKEYVERTGYNSEFPAADFDLIFSNILVDGDRWTLIDYEWTFGKEIDIRELAFRAIYCYLLEDEKRNRLDLERILEELGITQADAENYREQERNFQSFVTGKKYSMAQMRDLIGCRMTVPQKWIDRYQDSEAVNRVQIYEDTGEGYHEESSYFVQEAYQGENLIELSLKVSGDVRMLRIDPSMAACMVTIQEMTFNGAAVELKKRKMLSVNGKIVKPASSETGYCPSIVFPTDDPNINIAVEALDRKAENILYVRMELVRIPLTMAQNMAGAVKRLL